MNRFVSPPILFVFVVYKLICLFVFVVYKRCSYLVYTNLFFVFGVYKLICLFVFDLYIRIYLFGLCIYSCIFICVVLVCPLNLVAAVLRNYFTIDYIFGDSFLISEPFFIVSLLFFCKPT